MTLEEWGDSLRSAPTGRPTKVKDPVLIPTEFDIHRAAAWWAGEGSVVVSEHRLAINVSQKEIAVLVWFQERFGGSVTWREKCSDWHASGNRARRFLATVLPLLIESPRRQEQIRVALAKTAIPMKRGPQRKPICLRGHLKVVATDGRLRCVICGNAARKTSRLKPEIRERHRIREHDRYHRKRNHDVAG